MKKRITITSLIILALVCGGYIIYEYNRYDRTPGFAPLRLAAKKPERLRVKTVGASGQSFTVTLTVDGSRREISGVTPADFSLECIVLVGEVTKFDGDGSFSLLIERQNGIGQFYTPPVRDLQRFRYCDNSIGVLGRQ
jgi:hypothetical protein